MDIFELEAPYLSMPSGYDDYKLDNNEYDDWEEVLDEAAHIADGERDEFDIGDE